MTRTGFIEPVVEVRLVAVYLRQLMVTDRRPVANSASPEKDDLPVYHYMDATASPPRRAASLLDLGRRSANWWPYDGSRRSTDTAEAAMIRSLMRRHQRQNLTEEAA